MSFTYDETQLSVELNKIRLRIGDTDEDDVLLQDEEIAYVQSDNTSFLRRVAACCRLICAKLARRVDYKLSLLSEKASVLYDRYKSMAEMYDGKSSQDFPWTSSVRVSDHDAVEDDESLVKPKFKKGIMDNLPS